MPRPSDSVELSVTLGHLAAKLTEQKVTLQVMQVQGLHRLVAFRPGQPADISHHSDIPELLAALGRLALSSHSTETDDGQRSLPAGESSGGDERG